MIPLRDLQQQYKAMKAEIDQALLGTAASGAFIMGSAVEELEHQLADYVGVKHCITCANGTDALRLALMAMGVGKGDAVFVPDFTFFATAEAVAMVGATPVFVDVCEHTYNIDPLALERAVLQCKQHSALHPAAVVAVDLFGQPADYYKLLRLCVHHRLMLVEDGAQGFGGTFAGQRACSFGDISTTSFFPAKPLGCYGDGGALFTDNDHYASLLRSLRVHGRGGDKYDNVRLGLNSRLDTMQAAVLQVKLRHFDAELEAVNRTADLYSQQLQGGVGLPVVQQGCRSSWAQFTIRTPHRAAMQAALAEQGIASAVYYPRPLSQQSAFADLHQSACPVASQLCGQVLSVPIHPYLSTGDLSRVVEVIHQTLNVQ